MERNLPLMAEKEYDLIIIGAGAFGSCAAWDAASRGLSVALVERGDFCSATSANHLKVVHGGIRYLQHGDLLRVRESCRERTALLRIAPHLVRPLPIVMPTYGHNVLGKEMLALGVFIYDLVTCDRNRHLEDPKRRIPWGRPISRKACLRLFPGFRKSGHTGGCIFYDGQFYNPPRLSLAFIKSAVMAGADVGNYLQATGFLKNANRVFGVSVQDTLSGEHFDIQGKVVLNAAGPWADRLIDTGCGIHLHPRPTFSRDVGFVVSRQFTEKFALACMVKSRDADAIISRKGRHIFLVPWHDHTLIGVWHLVHKGHPSDFKVTEQELESYIDEINSAYPDLALCMDDVTMVNAGLTLFGDNNQNQKDLSFGKRSLLIDHYREHQLKGLITLIGVRATTARGMAEKAIDLAIKKMGKHELKSITEKTPIYGGRISCFEHFENQATKRYESILRPEIVHSLVHNHGSEYEAVLSYFNENKSWGDTLSKSGVIGAEVIHAVREEMAQKLSDIVFRRTDLGTAEYPGDDVLEACATLMASEMAWSDEKIRQEIDETKQSFPII